MKKLKIVPIGAIAILVVFLNSCSPFQQSSRSYDDDYGSRRSAYIDEPIFYSNSSPVLVRDAFSGKLFYIYPNNGYSPYGYGSSYDNGYYDQRVYRNQRSNRTYKKDTRKPQATPEQKQKQEQSRNIILGKQ